MENILSKIKEEFLTKFSENPFLMTIEKQAYFELPIYSKPYLFLILEGKAQLNLENGLINYEKVVIFFQKLILQNF